MQITIDKEFKDLIPPLQKEERDQLEANIKAEGCRDPLTVWGDILIDGHNRHEICTRLGVPFKTVSVSFPDRSHAIEWIIKNQFGRRNLAPYDRIVLASRLRETLENRGRDNQSKSGGDKKSAEAKSLRQISDKAIPGMPPIAEKSLSQKSAKAVARETGTEIGASLLCQISAKATTAPVASFPRPSHPA